MPHPCALCLKTQQRVYGPYGFKAWPAIAGKSFTWGGYIWACDEHRAELAAVWREHTDTGSATRAGAVAEQPRPASGGKLRSRPDDPEQGTLL